VPVPFAMYDACAHCPKLPCRLAFIDLHLAYTLGSNVPPWSHVSLQLHHSQQSCAMTLRTLFYHCSHLHLCLAHYLHLCLTHGLHCTLSFPFTCTYALNIVCALYLCLPWCLHLCPPHGLSLCRDGTTVHSMV